jgi:methanogenic corrinoid protein MtbC1
MVYGPFTVAGQVAGEQALLRGVVERPGEARQLLDKSLSLAQDYARLLLEAGAEVLWVSDPLAALLPPESFWEFAGEHLARLFAIKGDQNTALHICGDTSQIVPGMVETGVGGISFDQCLDLLALEDLVPPEVAVMGNLDPVEVLELAAPEEVARSAQELVMGLGAAPNFALCPGCAPPPSAPVANIRAFLENGRRALDLLAPHVDGLAGLSAGILAGEGGGLEEKVRRLRADGLGPMEVMSAGLMRAIKKSSALYETKRRHLPAVLLTVDAFYRGYQVLEPELVQAGESGPAVALGTVRGDFHEIGKNLVSIMLRAHGIPVLDLGVNVPAQNFVAACREHGCRVVGLSAFITSARKQLGEVMRALAEAGLAKVDMVAGGAAVTQHLASQAGARGYAKDAVAAVRLLQDILKERA